MPMTPHIHRIRARYAESDQMGFVHHSVCAVWLEEARIAWLRAIGTSYRDLEASGVLMPVVELRVAYRQPFRFDDEVELTTTAAILGPSRARFDTVLRLAGSPEPRAEASVTIATVNAQGRPIRMPAEVVAAGG